MSVSPANLASLGLTKNTMIIGCDVNHPGERELVESSISVAVGSTDPMFCKYSASIRVQERNRDETITQLDVMVEELMKEFSKANGAYPTNLIVLRDGLSEGQFEKAEKIEIAAIQKALTKLVKGGKITYIVVQKRHHTRFIRTTQVPAGKRDTFNVASGTVVDDSIVDPQYSMFYLNSHFSPLVSVNQKVFPMFPGLIFFSSPEPRVRPSRPSTSFCATTIVTR